MGSMSVWHWLIFLAVGLLLFGGKGKISSIMGDVADGIKSFKKGMADDQKPADPPKTIDAQAAKPLDASTSQTKTG
jgi:sec-independent protein translocase protein TatA